MYDYMRALQGRFSPEAICTEQQDEVIRLYRTLEKKLNRRHRMHLLELIDAESKLREDVSLESFVAGFRLACGIAHELGMEPPYSFIQDGERRVCGA